MAWGAERGTKMTGGRAAPAIMQAKEAAALPAEAAATTRSPVSQARAATMALARSLREAEGLRPSSLT